MASHLPATAARPEEASLLQVAKYLIPRMREWGRSDIHGLAIVNHQRNLPGLEREHEHVFQADVLSNAEQQGFGLLTTWDLFRLVRGFIIHGWHHDDIAGLFVTAGRIRPVPAHYEFIGAVDGYWAQASAGCSEHCRRPASATCARRRVGRENA
jgi:hypothetical protein